MSFHSVLKLIDSYILVRSDGVSDVITVSYISYDTLHMHTTFNTAEDDNN